MDTEQSARRRKIANATLFESWRSDGVADRAQWVGYATSTIGFIIAFALVFACNPAVLSPEPLLGLLLLLMGASLPLGLMSGWLAHRLFYRTLVPVNWMAIAFALLGDVTVLGWLFVAFAVD